MMIPGMAHFAGTGPTGKRCEHCTHFRHKTEKPGRPSTMQAGRKKHCTKYRNLMGKWGPLISGNNQACKYMEGVKVHG